MVTVLWLLLHLLLLRLLLGRETVANVGAGSRRRTTGIRRRGGEEIAIILLLLWRHRPIRNPTIVILIPARSHRRLTMRRLLLLLLLRRHMFVQGRNEAAVIQRAAMVINQPSTHSAAPAGTTHLIPSSHIVLFYQCTQLPGAWISDLARRGRVGINVHTIIAPGL